jgi:tetratricopeptide (TPR) repeat protein
VVQQPRHVEVRVVANEDEVLAPEPEAPAPPASTRPVIKKRTRRKERQEELQQPDEFIEVGGSVVDWVLERGQYFGIAVGVVLLIVLVYGVAGRMQSNTRAQAAEAYYVARTELPSGGAGSLLSLTLGNSKDEDAKKLAEAQAKFDSLFSEYGSTPQSAMAALELASAHYQAGNYDKALTYYDQAASAGGHVGSLAGSGRAYTLESLERWDEAAAAFGAIRDGSAGEVKAQATLDLARVHEGKGDLDKARELYTAFETEFPDSLLLPDAQARAAAIASR